MMELTFTQAAKGINKEMSINIDATCQRCDGKGNEPGTKVQHCSHCNGSGMVSAVHRKTPPQLDLCFVLFFPLMCVYNVVPAGNREHRSVCDALHMSPVWRQGHDHLQPLPLLPREGSDQAEEDCDGSGAGWSVS